MTLQTFVALSVPIDSWLVFASSLQPALAIGVVALAFALRGILMVFGTLEYRSSPEAHLRGLAG